MSWHWYFHCDCEMSTSPLLFFTFPEFMILRESVDFLKLGCRVGINIVYPFLLFLWFGLLATVYLVHRS